MPFDPYTFSLNEKKKNGNEGELTAAVLQCAREIHELHLSHNNNAILQRIAQMEERIMSVISDFAAKQKAFNDRQTAAVDKLVTGVEGLTGDIKTLNDKITELQNSPGGVTPEDQVLINELETAGEALATKAEAIATAIDQLDSQTPPVVPPVT